MRAALLGLSLLLVAGCGGGGPAPLPTAAISAGFPPHGIADTIQIRTVDRLPLHAAELIAPDGAATPAASIAVNPAPGFRTGQRLGNDPYAGGVFGVGNVDLAAPMTGAGAAPQTRTRLLLMLSDAAIPLPDPVAYRKNWARCRIRLVFGTPPAAIETRTIAAPAPPAG